MASLEERPACVHPSWFSTFAEGISPDGDAPDPCIPGSWLWVPCPGFEEGGGRGAGAVFVLGRVVFAAVFGAGLVAWVACGGVVVMVWVPLS